MDYVRRDHAAAKKTRGHRLLATGFDHENSIYKTEVNNVFFPEGRWVAAKNFLKQESSDPCHILHPLMVPVFSFWNSPL